MALERVRELRGETYAPNEVWVIGDTEHDLACARAAGVRCLLVGTNWDGVDDLTGLEPDHYVRDLSETDTILRLLIDG
jgi:phosphoglycolate phosphatase-like HAD superfamily hydrolase